MGIENHFAKKAKRSKQFSWRNMAKEYLKLYELIHAEHSKNNKS
jgi:glycosyltransferase involved in cell wall biosynthesis